MHFDDRLATVLRLRASGERSARTQFRQLIDLLGERPQAGDPALRAAAYLRLIALGELIPARQRADIVAEHGWRLRNPDLVKWFASAAPEVAGAALYRARLTGEEWAALIPQLPLRARGFLRHRRDLPAEAEQVLDRLGVQDRALPLPDHFELTEPVEEPAPPVAAAQPASTPPQPEPGPKPEPARPQGEIGAIVARIEAFQRSRTRAPADAASDAPALPLGGLDRPPAPRRPLAAFHFATDARGRIDWADPEVAPMVTGLDLAALPAAPGAPLSAAAAFQNRQPIRDLPVVLRGALAIEGHWVCDAAPRFSPGEGHFTGYIGRLRRAVDPVPDRRAAEADRLRQLLHELRTPVNAMQGYAEVIQQQVFGPTPHEYRALAAAIAADSARILAGFEELDRLARLEGGALDLEPGESDFAAIAAAQVAQLQTVLSPRVARLQAAFPEGPALLAIARPEAEKLAWRVLATLAGAIGAGETVALVMRSDEGEIELRADLPAALKTAADIFSARTQVSAATLSAGIFGAGFSLRLARAEARAAGGELLREDDALVLRLPLANGAGQANGQLLSNGSAA